MMILGCDFHTRYQQIAMLDEATGELTERCLDQQSGEADAFYRNLQGPVRVGIEATGPIRWFERLLAELGHELWIGDAAKIRASEVRKQKTDERDARLILGLLLTKRFPKIWVPTPAERGLPQLLGHRHKLVCLRTLVGNQLHALALSEGLCRKEKLFTQQGRGELAGLALGPWASRRRAFTIFVVLFSVERTAASAPRREEPWASASIQIWSPLHSICRDIASLKVSGWCAASPCARAAFWAPWALRWKLWWAAILRSSRKCVKRPAKNRWN
jgi:hypothetical protein